MTKPAGCRMCRAGKPCRACAAVGAKSTEKLDLKYPALDRSFGDPLFNEDREINPDGTIACGVFIPLPFDLARQFPNKDHEDDSVPHVTLLYVGNVSPEDYASVVIAVTRVARHWTPFSLDMQTYGEFHNPKGQLIPHMKPRARGLRTSLLDASGFENHLGFLHADLKQAVERLGVPVAHTYGYDADPTKPDWFNFKAHATLDYLPGDASYDGPKPMGSWRVTDLECWGHEKYRIPLGAKVADQPKMSLFDRIAESENLDEIAAAGLGLAALGAYGAHKAMQHLMPDEYEQRARERKREKAKREKAEKKAKDKAYKAKKKERGSAARRSDAEIDKDHAEAKAASEKHRKEGDAHEERAKASHDRIDKEHERLEKSGLLKKNRFGEYQATSKGRGHPEVEALNKKYDDHNKILDDRDASWKQADDHEGHARRHDFEKKTGRKWDHDKHPTGDGHEVDLKAAHQQLKDANHPDHEHVAKIVKKGECTKDKGMMVFGKCILKKKKKQESTEGSLFDRIAEDASLLEAKKKEDVRKQVEKAASATAGIPLTVSKVNDLGAKGVDFHFKEGGLVKIRPKADGVVLAKLQGQPKPHYRYKGVGTDGPSALAAMKPEKGKKVPGKPLGHGLKKKPKPKAEPAAPAKPGPKAANIGGLRLINDLQVDEATWDRYATAAKDSVDLLKKRGFGFMLKNVTMHLRQSKMPGVLGNYDMKKKLVEIFVNTIGWKADKRHIMFTMVHELGHHYYYREIPRAKRKSYRWYFDTAKKPTQGGKKSGDFPTAYATSARYEDFAEIFAAYIGKGHHLSSKYKLTKDSMDRFKTFLAFDKRIDLREDDELVGADLLLADLEEIGG